MVVHSVDFDYYPARPNQLLKEGRYKVLRKLGSGVWSSTWLVLDGRWDHEDSKYLAVKILTADATRRHNSGEMGELQFLRTIQEFPDSHRHLPLLRDNFEEAGPQGSHLCIVTTLLSTDVGSLRRSSPKKALPFHIVRNIVAMVVEALANLHKTKIVHTDVKPDNILFKCSLTTEEIDDIARPVFLEIAGEFELDGEKYPILKSQPIPHRYTWDSSPHHAELMSVVLNDLGQAQKAGYQPTVDCFSAVPLRAPEVILRSDFGPGLDIWAVGCVTFELLVGRWLFHPEGGEGWSVEDDHLAKMMELTGERFPVSMLDRAQRRNEYFDDEGNLLRIKELIPVSLEQAMAIYNVLPQHEIEMAASFIRSCLRFDYKDRATAKELEHHPFLLDASGC